MCVCEHECSCPHGPGEGTGQLGLVLEADDVGVGWCFVEEAGIVSVGLHFPGILTKQEASEMQIMYFDAQCA